MEENRNYSLGPEFGTDNAYYNEENAACYSGEDTGEKTYSMTKGILGALVGTVIGIALWCLAALTGYVIPYLSVIMGFVIVVCFMKFAGTIDMTGAVISVLFLLLGNYAGLHMYYAVFFYDWRPDFWLCITNLYTYLVQYDMMGSFIKNLVISYVCAFVGIFGAFRKTM